MATDKAGEQSAAPWKNHALDVLKKLAAFPARYYITGVDVTAINRLIDSLEFPEASTAEQSPEPRPISCESPAPAPAPAPRSPAPVAHIVGQGGKCWCGELHADYVEPAERVAAPPEPSMTRWEVGVRNIVTILVGPRTEFEISDIVERVRELQAKVLTLEQALRTIEGIGGVQGELARNALEG